MKPELDNSFCWYPFYQLTARGFMNENSGVVSPCCLMLEWDPPFKELMGQRKTFSELFHSESFHKFRQQLLNNEKPNECRSCWEAEKLGSNSPRLQSFRDVPVGYEVDINNPKLVTLDVSTGNNCNLRCRMCQPGSSNKLKMDMKMMTADEIKTIQWENFQKVHGDGNHTINEGKPDNYIGWKQIDNEDIKKLKVIGGESLVTDSFIEVLEKLNLNGKAKETELSITTNGTKFTDEVMSLINNFKSVEIMLSIDGTEKIYEYVRYPMTWSKFTKSLNKFKTAIKTDYHINVSSVLSVYNLFNIQDLVEWLEKESLGDLYLSQVHPSGRGIDTVNLPSNILCDAISTINFNKVNGTGKDYLLSLVNNNTSNKEKILNEIKIMDRIRNQDYHDFLPKQIIDFLDS